MSHWTPKVVNAFSNWVWSPKTIKRIPKQFQFSAQNNYNYAHYCVPNSLLPWSFLNMSTKLLTAMAADPDSFIIRPRTSKVLSSSWETSVMSTNACWHQQWILCSSMNDWRWMEKMKTIHISGCRFHFFSVFLLIFSLIVYKLFTPAWAWPLVLAAVTSFPSRLPSAFTRIGGLDWNKNQY